MYNVNSVMIITSSAISKLRNTRRTFKMSTYTRFQSVSHQHNYTK